MRGLSCHYWRLVERLNLTDDQQSLLWAVVIGIGGGLIAFVLRLAIDGMTRLIFRDLAGMAGFESSTDLGWQFIQPLLPMIGGLLMAPVVLRWAVEAKGHGVSEVMLAMAREGGRIRPRVGVVKGIASAITIGTGGSAGQEGPIVQIGSALGSSIGQGLQMPARKIKTFLACGAAAGISAVFNTPITGVFFAVEILLGEIRPRSFSFIVVSAATSWMVATGLMGDHPLLVIPSWRLSTPWELALCMVLGICAALMARLFVVTFYWCEDLFENIRISPYLKPALGGLGVGIIGIAFPQVFGSGYAAMTAAAHGTVHNRLGALMSQRFDPDSPLLLMLPSVLAAETPTGSPVVRSAAPGLVLTAMAIMLLLAFAKILATSLTLGSGGSGGVFAPALFIGAMFGGAFGLALESLLPGQTAPAGAYAVMGMAATFAASAHAPVTAILLLYELMRHHALIPGIMVATVVATLIAYRLSPDSIYTVKFKRRGWRIGDMQARDPLQQIQVRDAMVTEFFRLQPDMTVQQALLYAETVGQRAYPVVEENGNNLLGLITVHDLNLAIASRRPETTPIAELMDPSPPVVTPEDHLDRAVALLDNTDAPMLPVVAARGDRRLVGALTHATLIRAYGEYQRERE